MVGSCCGQASLQAETTNSTLMGGVIMKLIKGYCPEMVGDCVCFAFASGTRVEEHKPDGGANVPNRATTRPGTLPRLDGG